MGDCPPTTYHIVPAMFGIWGPAVLVAAEGPTVLYLYTQSWTDEPREDDQEPEDDKHLPLADRPRREPGTKLGTPFPGLLLRNLD